MNREDFKNRTKIFAINVASVCKNLPYDIITKWYIAQLVRCSSSVAANYRAACRARSKADFINKLRIVEEESDESVFFIEMLQVFAPKYNEPLEDLRNEGEQIISMVVASINTVLRNKSAIGNRKS
jgi:four helix bundle protein